MTTRGPSFSRRALFAAGIALGVRGDAAAQPAGKAIDVHHHVAPPSWLQAGGTADEERVFKNWSVARALEEMDQRGVATGYSSITVPGKRFDSLEAAKRTSRECNDFMASIRAQHPGRFGVFGLVPMPDVDATLAEIAYAYDTLKADGIGLFTSYGKKWLGDAAFDPVFAELNRRKAVVFVHPVGNACCIGLQPYVSSAAIEYGTDTTRALAEYVFSGASQRFPDVKMIWSHAGGTMPYLVQRFINGANEGLKSRVPNGFLPEAQKFYYDTAQVPNRGPMLALRAIVPVSQILYGTDYPYRTFAWTTEMLTSGNVFSAAELDAVSTGNATRLLKKAAGS